MCLLGFLLRNQVELISILSAGEFLNICSSLLSLGHIFILVGDQPPVIESSLIISDVALLT